VNEKVDFNWKKLLQKKVGGPLSFLFIFMMFAMILHETPFLVLFSQYLFASNSKEKMNFSEGKFILYSIFWSPFFFGGCEKRSSWIFFLQPHPCTPEKGKKMK
jgi:hypothetical protein